MERITITNLQAAALTAALALAAAACGDDGGAEPGELTYYRDVKPILDAKCAVCHFAGGVAPFALTSYQDALTYAGSIKLAVEDRTMPPWHADDDCNDYYAVRALDDAQRAAIVDWVGAGTPEGDPSSEGAPIEVESTELSRVDSTLTMLEEYVPATGPDEYDDYRCFILPWSEDATTYVTGFRARPGNLTVAHHAIAFLATPDQASLYMDLDAADEGPGWGCFGGPGGPMPQWVGGWAPGNAGSDLPTGVGIEVQPGSLIVLQMHYNTVNLTGVDVGPDRTSLDFRLDAQVDRPARILPWANPNWVGGAEPMLIPANDPDVMHSFSFDPTIFPFGGVNRVVVYDAGLHMHRLGTRARLTIERADGTSECVLSISEWDFDWQASYLLREPRTVESGDELQVECHFDNSPENQPLVGGEPRIPSDVTWGEDSSDEMCLGIFLVTAE